MHIYIPNMGGSGLRIPQNILALGMLGLLMLLVALKRSQSASFSLRISPGTQWMLAGCLMLCLPIFWSPLPMWRWNAFPSVLGYLMAALVYVALLQVRISPQQKRRWLAIILLSTVIEAGLALMQLLYFSNENWMEYSIKHGRIYGIFQQPNLLGSYLATGCGIALYFIFTSRRQLVRLGAANALAILLLVIIPTQSRVGWLGALVVSLPLLWYFRSRHHLKHPLLKVIPCMLVMLAVLFYACFRDNFLVGNVGDLVPNVVADSAAHLTKNPAFAIVDKSHSNSIRWQMIQHSLHMIALHPFAGWGMGGFEHNFTQHVVMMNSSMTVEGRPPTHPHNEIIYQWIEGGIVALIGCLLLIFCWARLAFGRKALRFRRAFPIWCLTLPIALHTLFEYPLYLSSAHGIVLLILLRLTLPEHKLREFKLARQLHHAGRVSTLAIALSVMLFSATGFQTHKLLTSAERNRFEGMGKSAGLVNPWIQWERYIFDNQMYALTLFNETQDYRYLIQFKIWGDSYIRVHNDANVYFTLIRIAGVQQSLARQQQLLQRAKRLFPGDVRFK